MAVEGSGESVNEREVDGSFDSSENVTLRYLVLQRESIKQPRLLASDSHHHSHSSCQRFPYSFCHQALRTARAKNEVGNRPVIISLSK